jgi:hypothetical protein
VKGTKGLYDFLYRNRERVKMGLSGGRNVAVSYLKVGVSERIKETIYIPLYYPKDRVSDKGPKQLGFAKFK